MLKFFGLSSIIGCSALYLKLKVSQPVPFIEEYLVLNNDNVRTYSYPKYKILLKTSNPKNTLIIHEINIISNDPNNNINIFITKSTFVHKVSSLLNKKDLNVSCNTILSSLVTVYPSTINRNTSDWFKDFLIHIYNKKVKIEIFYSNEWYFKKQKTQFSLCQGKI